MAPELQRIVALALELPPHERVSIARALVASVTTAELRDGRLSDVGAASLEVERRLWNLQRVLLARASGPAVPSDSR